MFELDHDQIIPLLSKKRGVILLDLDGTLLSPKMEDHKPLQDFFEEVCKQDWIVVFATGRTYHYALTQAKMLCSKAWIACYNGSMLMKPVEDTSEPGKYEVVYSSFISLDKHEDFLNKLFLEFPVLLCHPSIPGDEGECQCYYMTPPVDEEQEKYFEWRQQKTKEKWVRVNSLRESGIAYSPAIKYFGPRENAETVAQRIKAATDLAGNIIRDGHSNYAILQCTAKDSDKGLVVRYFKELRKSSGRLFPIMAAGNDMNDLPMLDLADLSITVEDAPEILQDICPYIAQKPEKFGVVYTISRIIGLKSINIYS